MRSDTQDSTPGWWTRPSTPRDAPVSHLDLLYEARALHHAAISHEPDVLRARLTRLRSALIRHTQDERGAFVHRSPAAQQLIDRGQQQLLEHLDQILARDDTDSSSRARVAELTYRLGRQVRLEAGIPR